MRRNMLWVFLFGLILGGCASNAKMGSSDVSSAPAEPDVATSSPSTSEGKASSSTMVATTPTDSGVTIKSGSSQNRIAAGIDEETLDTCLARIPQDATTGQKMLAEQTCRRDFATRR